MPDEKKLQAAATLLESLDITIDEVAAYLAGGATTPTVAEFYDRGLAGISPKARLKYRGYIEVLRYGLPDVCWCRCQRCYSHWDKPSHTYTCPCTVGSCDCPPSADEAPTIEVVTVDGRTTANTGLVARPNCDVRLTGLADLPLGAVTADLLNVQSNWVKRRAKKRWDRSNAARIESDRVLYRHDGRGAVEGYLSSARAWFEVAVTADILRKNPAGPLKKPRRVAMGARALTVVQMEELWDAVWTTGSRDPELDMMILWFHLETGTRRGGALNLTVDRVSTSRALATIIEKGDRERDQLMTPELVEALLAFAHRRGSVDGNPLPPGAPVFYYRPNVGEDGQNIPHPLTKRRYDNLFARLRRRIPWADELFLRPHDLRKTAASFIERAAGHAVAKAYLGHGDVTVTDTYVQAHQEEIAAALVAYTGRSHPLAPAVDGGDAAR